MAWSSKKARIVSHGRNSANYTLLDAVSDARLCAFFRHGLNTRFITAIDMFSTVNAQLKIFACPLDTLSGLILLSDPYC